MRTPLFIYRSLPASILSRQLTCSRRTGFDGKARFFILYRVVSVMLRNPEHRILMSLWSGFDNGVEGSR